MIDTTQSRLVRSCSSKYCSLASRGSQKNSRWENNLCDSKNYRPNWRQKIYISGMIKYMWSNTLKREALLLGPLSSSILVLGTTLFVFASNVSVGHHKALHGPTIKVQWYWAGQNHTIKCISLNIGTVVSHSQPIVIYIWVR